MNGVEVHCGCGRTMTMDAIRGRGAFRCGCGVRITMTSPEHPVCGGVGEGGGRCVRVPMRDSLDLGVYLCREHLKMFRAHLDQVANENSKQAAWDAYCEADLKRARESSPRIRREVTVDKAREEGRLTVYYIRIGDYIKIGTTTDLAHRMSALQPDEILAAEPGYVELERERHRQFKHLRRSPRSERFRAAPDLIEHIKTIRDRYGVPTGRFEIQDTQART